MPVQHTQTSVGIQNKRNHTLLTFKRSKMVLSQTGGGGWFTVSAYVDDGTVFISGQYGSVLWSALVVYERAYYTQVSVSVLWNTWWCMKELITHRWECYYTQVRVLLHTGESVITHRWGCYYTQVRVSVLCCALAVYDRASAAEVNWGKSDGLLLGWSSLVCEGVVMCYVF